MDDMLIKSKEEENHLDDLKKTFDTLRQYNMKLNLAKCAFGVSSGKFLGFMVSQRRIEENPKKVKAILEMSFPRRSKKCSPLQEGRQPSTGSSPDRKSTRLNSSHRP